MSGPGDGVAKTRYISCTPLLGSDDQVGVWMVVMVENETVTGSLPSRTAALNRSYTNHTTHTNDSPIPQMPRTPEAFQTQHQQQSQYQPNHHGHTQGDSFDSDASHSQQQQQRYERTTSSTIRGGGGSIGNGGKRPGSEGGRLYAEFMRNQSSKKGAEEWKGDYLSNGGGGGGGGVVGDVDADAGRFEEVGSP